MSDLMPGGGRNLFRGGGKSKQDSYRSVEVYTLEGSASIMRQEVGELAAYENLFLESGDTVQTHEKSSMRLKLDDDKYVLAQENTRFELVAEGTRRDSRTKIDLKAGAIINELQNPLSDKSSYEVHTPNAVMAVRGTCFHIEVKKEEDGSWRTLLDTFDGSVSSQLKNPDGTVSQEKVAVNAGWHIEVGNDESESWYPSEASQINYEEQSKEVLEFLNEVLLDGRETGISAEELKRILENKEREAQGEKNVPGFTLLPEQSSSEPELPKLPVLKPDRQTAALTEDGKWKGLELPADGGGTGSAWITDGNGAGSAAGKSGGNSAGNTTGKPDGGNAGNTTGKPDGGNAGNATGKPDGGNAGNITGKPDGGNAGNTTGKPDGGNAGNATGKPDGGNAGNITGKPDGGNAGNTTGKPDGGSTEHPGGSGSAGTPGNSGESGGSDMPKDTVCHVTFLYQDTVFGTQEVTQGDLAEKPTLAPADVGNWDYDFTTPVTSDISIRWLSNAQAEDR